MALISAWIATRPGFGGRVVVGDRGLDDRVVEMLLLLHPFRRLHSLIECCELGPALGGADHAHGHFVSVAPSVELVLVLGEAVAAPGFRVDHVDGDVDVRMIRIGVADDDIPGGPSRSMKRRQSRAVCL